MRCSDPRRNLETLRSGWRVSGRSRAGLTLVELAVTLAVLTLAATIAAPAFIRFQQASQLQWAAQRTMALAGEARGLAVSGDTLVRLEYDPQGHGLRMVTEPQDGGEAPISERRTPDARFLELPLDVEVAFEKDTGPSDGGLSFYPDGRSDPLRVRLQRLGFPPLTLAMNARTGRLRLQEQSE
jgi:prepilin-type N-terminal cleavage/methylation domain-containing protein